MRNTRVRIANTYMAIQRTLSERVNRLRPAWSWGVLSFVFGLAVLAPPALVWGQTPAITEYPTPTASSGPVGITTGPDGNLWFVEAGGNKIGRITPLGAITEFTTPTASSKPYGIASGPDGNLWFTENFGHPGTIGRITTAGVITEYPIPPANSGNPVDIASGPDGNLWFTNPGDNNIGRITPAGAITAFPVPTTASGAYTIASGPDGNLWFIEINVGKIGRITPAGVITEFPVTVPFDLEGIASGPDGNIWFTEKFSGKIGRVLTASPYTITVFTVPTSGSTPYRIAPGPCGDLWFTEWGGNKIGRITTAGVITPADEFPVPTANSSPAGIVTGPDGNPWFTEFTGNKIGKLSPPCACVPPPPNMVAWYPLDEQSGATVVNDIAPPPGSMVNNVGTPKPNGSVGFPNGPNPVSGMVGGALYFVTGVYVEVPPQSELDFGIGDFSIDAWVRPVDCSQGGGGVLSPIVDKFNGTTGFSFYLDQPTVGVANLYLNINGSTFTSSATIPTLGSATWSHVAVTVARPSSGNQVGTLYINGSPAGTFTPPPGSVTNLVPTWIGELRVSGGRCEIAIDELELFNRALSQTEIQGIVNAGPAGKCKTTCTLTCTATASPASGAPPLVVTFTSSATATGCTGTVAYDWEFGDGSSHSTAQNPSHTYTSAGAFTWTATVTVNGQTCAQTGAIQVTCASPVITSVTKVGPPFTLKLLGPHICSPPYNFDYSCTVWIENPPSSGTFQQWPPGGVAVPPIEIVVGTPGTCNQGSQIKIKQGHTLKALFPHGIPVTIKVVNSDGCFTTITYTRP